jgi:hypothetical protein
MINDMNIHKYQKQISELLFEKKEKSGKKQALVKRHFAGCYIVSRTKGYNLFKLGTAWGKGGLYARIIGQYKVCMSLKSEFFMRYLVITPRIQQGKLWYSQIMEKELLKTIDSKEKESYSQEWIFTPDISVLERRMFKVLQSHEKYYTMALKFTQAGVRFYNHKKNSFDSRLYSFCELPSLNPLVGLLELEKSATEKFYEVKPKKIKKPVVYSHMLKKNTKVDIALNALMNLSS